MKRLRLTGAVLVAAVLGALAIASAGSAARPSAGSTLVSVPVSTTDPTGSFTGSLDITRFVAQNGQVLAVGTLTGTVTNLLTGAVTTISQTVTAPLQATAGTCGILHLELGPIDLNLLGVLVHTDKIVVDVSAQSGPGNLLGNLLCGVSNALDANRSANGLANLLNHILGLL
jgi:hypothetical protein